MNRRSKKNIVSITHFVDVNEINKKVYEGNPPRSLIWDEEVAQGSRIALNRPTKYEIKKTYVSEAHFVDPNEISKKVWCGMDDFPRSTESTLWATGQNSL